MFRCSLFLVLVLASRVLAATDPAIRVVEVVGEVELLRAGQESAPLALGPGDVVVVSDRIYTGVESMVKLRFADDSVVEVKELTDMKVAAFVPGADTVTTRLWLKAGEVAADIVPAKAARSDFSIRTPTATCSVRGTGLGVRAILGRTLQWTRYGSVLMKSLDGSQTTNQRGQSSHVASTGKLQTDTQVRTETSQVATLPQGTTQIEQDATQESTGFTSKTGGTAPADPAGTSGTTVVNNAVNETTGTMDSGTGTGTGGSGGGSGEGTGGETINGFNMVQIAQQGVQLQGASSPFVGFGSAGQDSGGVVYEGSVQAMHQVIARTTGPGQDTLIAETQVTQRPGASPGTPFQAFTGILDIDGGNVSFASLAGPPTPNPPFPPVDGIYGHINGQLRRIADNMTGVPGQGGTFNNFGPVTSIDNGKVAFSGSGPTGNGIFQGDGVNPLQTLLASGSPAPGGSSFSTVIDPSLDGNNFAFVGSTPNANGIFKTVNGTTSLVAGVGQPLPGGGALQGFGIPLGFDGSSVAFLGIIDQNQPIEGIFTDRNGGLESIARTGGPIPGSTNNFGSFSPPSIDNGVIMFASGVQQQLQGGESVRDPQAGPTGTSSTLFIDRNNGAGVQPIIGTGNTLGGQVVQNVIFQPSGGGSNSVAFTASFQNGTSGVFVGNSGAPGPVTQFSQTSH